MADFTTEPRKLIFQLVGPAAKAVPTSSRSFKSASTDIEERLLLAISISKNGNIDAFPKDEQVMVHRDG
jgi:hypothetical protein